MSTVEKELQTLIDQFSEEEIENANLDSVSISVEKQEEIEHELTEMVSLRTFFEDHKDEILEGTIIDYGFVKEDSDTNYNTLDTTDSFEPIYFTIRFPCGSTHDITFTQSDIGPNEDKLSQFLDCIGCTITDLSNAKHKKIPVTYTYNRTVEQWRIYVFYTNREQTKKFLEEPAKFSLNVDDIVGSVHKKRSLKKRLFVYGGFAGLSGVWTWICVMYATSGFHPLLISILGIILLFSLTLSLTTKSIDVKKFKIEA